MSISLLTNLAAMTVRRHLNESSEAYGTSMERMASGKRINRAGEDAAGLSVAETVEARVRAVYRARLNALEALSFVQVAEGGMNEASNILIRLRELAVQAASDTIGDRERELLELEAIQLKKELKRLAESTKYFDTQLLVGSGKTFTFQIGPDDNEYNRITYDTSNIDLRPETLGVEDITINDKESAVESLASVDEAIKRLGAPRAEVGAIQSRMHSIVRHLEEEEESLTAAHSRIMDADLAKETSNVVREQIRQKAGIAVLSQANALPYLALKLIEG